jgi:arthrofactin-type cyclic lipopeptide synthetase C
MNQRRQEKCLERWKRWAPGVELWHGPGNHMTILNPPHVYALADWLRRLLYLGSDMQRSEKLPSKIPDRS